MSREIKFRAWDKKLLIIIPDNEMAGMQEYGIGRTTLQSIFNHPDYEVMQYTGLKDKNGVEIFEGDVLKYSDGGDVSHHRIYWDVKTAKYYDERLEDGDSNSVYYGFEFVESCIVIGNIYENPELLK